MINSCIVMVPNPCPHHGFVIYLVFNQAMRAMFVDLAQQGHGPEWVLVEAESMVHRAKEIFPPGGPVRWKERP
jgi:hypothetical protein